MRLPVPDGIGLSQEYGITPFYHSSGWYPTPGHLGVDYPTPIGTPIMAPTAGEIHHVGYSSEHPGWGYYLELRDGLRTHYVAHMKDGSAKVAVGQQVNEGDVVGASGNTGTASTGPHTHWQVIDVANGPAAMNHAVDPETLLHPERYRRQALEDYAELAALREGLDPFYFKRQINQESGWQMYAHSPANAIGLAQIVPKWHPSVNPWKPYESIDYAARLMSSHLERFGRIDYALAAYNAGPGAVAEWSGVPPYPETQNYVRVILDGWEAPMAGDQPESQAIDNWLKTEWEKLAQKAIGIVVRADAGTQPTEAEVAAVNQGYKNLIENWPALWAAEKARRDT